MERIGIFGGTFNPIHVGHLMIAEEARIAAALDRVIFVPSGESYLKDPAQIASKADRLEMARRATADAPYFEVSDVETRREGPSYTAETLAVFRALYPRDALFLILGADSLLEIERWRDPAGIFRAAEVLAFDRGGVPSEAVVEKARELEARFDARISVVSAFSLSVSSSDIRGFIRGGHAFRPLVGDGVWAYINENGLYGARASKEVDA